MSQRVGANLVISQYWMSKSQGSQRKVKREPSRATREETFPIASRPLAISTSAPGTSCSRSALMIRAGRSWPSPMSALSTRTRGGRSSKRAAPASRAPAAWSLPFSEGCLPGTGSGGRVRVANPFDVLAYALA